MDDAAATRGIGIMSDLFSGDAAPLETQIKCVEREVAMREKVYPRWVANGKMTDGFADSQIKIMKDVVESLKRLRGIQP
jgi:hypothetical protein